MEISLIVLALFIFGLNGALLGAGYWFFKVIQAATLRAEALNQKWDELFAKVNELHNTTVMQQKKMAEWMTITEMQKVTRK